MWGRDISFLSLWRQRWVIGGVADVDATVVVELVAVAVDAGVEVGVVGNVDWKMM